MKLFYSLPSAETLCEFVLMNLTGDIFGEGSEKVNLISINNNLYQYRF